MINIFELQTITDVPLTSLEINAGTTGVTTVGTFRIKTTYPWGWAWSVKFGVMTVDRQPKSTGLRRGLAGTAVDCRWFEARIGAGAWTPVGGHPLDVDVALIATAPGDPIFRDVDLRLNIPAGAEIGSFCAAPFVVWRFNS